MIVRMDANEVNVCKVDGCRFVGFSGSSGLRQCYVSVVSRVKSVMFGLSVLSGLVCQVWKRASLEHWAHTPPAAHPGIGYQ